MRKRCATWTCELGSNADGILERFMLQDFFLHARDRSELGRVAGLSLYR
jgi:hypothetical protein